jgi:hypothetical protein
VLGENLEPLLPVERSVDLPQALHREEPTRSESRTPLVKAGDVMHRSERVVTCISRILVEQDGSLQRHRALPADASVHGNRHEMSSRESKRRFVVSRMRLLVSNAALSVAIEEASSGSKART